jgi:metal-responsive CopG/Arc/MetJ family transcriptional regulator
MQYESGIMTFIQISVDENILFKIDIIKAKMRFTNRAETVNYILSEFKSELLE